MILLGIVLVLVITMVASTAILWYRVGAPTAVGVPTIDTQPAYVATDAGGGTPPIIDDLIPAGTIWSFTNNLEVPHGWLPCEGQSLLKAAYARLYAATGLVFTRDGISAAGRDYFDLPDLRGVFIRGADTGNGVDDGRTFGSYQEDGMPFHGHDNYSRMGSSSHIGPAIYNAIDNPFNRVILQYPKNGTPATEEMSPGGADETRPDNVALLYCIKT